MPGIILTTGETAIVDEIDYIELDSFTWYSMHTRSITYARRCVRETKEHVLLHRVIGSRMGLNINGNLIDHKNLNGLDNRRANLRLCNNSQNHANVVKYANNSSGYKGVNFNAATNSWRARLAKRHLGLFSTPEEAALAYNKAAKQFYGEFALLNEL